MRRAPTSIAASATTSKRSVAERRPAPVAVVERRTRFEVERARRRRRAEPAQANAALGPARSDELPRAIVSAHAPSYAPAAGRELVAELGADVATRLAQTRALTVLAVDSPAEIEAQNCGRLPRRSPPRPRSRRHHSVAPADVAGASDSLGRVVRRQRPVFRPRAGSRSMRLCVTSRIARSRCGVAEKRRASAIGLTLEAQRLLNAIDLPSIRRARRLLRSAQAVAPDFVPTIAALARSHVMEWLVRAPFEVAPLEFAEQFAKRAIAHRPGRLPRLSRTRPGARLSTAARRRHRVPQSHGEFVP